METRRAIAALEAETGRLVLHVSCQGVHVMRRILAEAIFKVPQEDIHMLCHDVGGARRMVDSAALLVDEVLPKKPIRQWVLTVPFPLRFLFAAYPELMSKVLGIVTRALSTHLIHQAGFKKKDAHTGAVTLIQRFGSALNLNIHSDVHGRTNVAGAWMRRSGHCQTGSVSAQAQGQLNQV